MKYIIIIFLTLSTCLANGQVNTIDSLELIKIIDQRVDSFKQQFDVPGACLLYTSPSPRDQRGSRMPSSA